jgi:hypothetical protein
MIESTANVLLVTSKNGSMNRGDTRRVTECSDAPRVQFSLGEKARSKPSNGDAPRRGRSLSSAPCLLSQ